MKSILFAIMFLSGCSSDEENRFEVINKLRALGVTASPSFLSQEAAPLTPISLEFHAVMPAGGEVTVESYDNKAATGLTMAATPDPSSIVYRDEGGLRFVSFKANAVIPPVVSALSFTGTTSFGVSYGVKVRSGSEEENIAGSILIFDPKAVPSVNDLKVQVGSTAGFKNGTKSKLEATLVNPQNENYKIGWYVSSGLVENRRGLSTFWTPSKSGKENIIITARGLNTGSFNFASAVVDVAE